MKYGLESMGLKTGTVSPMMKAWILKFKIFLSVESVSRFLKREMNGQQKSQSICKNSTWPVHSLLDFQVRVFRFQISNVP